MTRKPVSVGEIKSNISGNLSTNEIVKSIEKECKASVIINSGHGKRNIVIFLPHAWDNFCASTNYGKYTPENRNESHYILEGYYFIDNNGRTTTVVSHIITPFSVSSGASSAELYSEGKESAYEYIEKKEEEIRKYSDEGKYSDSKGVLNPLYKKFGTPIRVGFGHTHPRNIDVFFSSVDRTSVFAAEGDPWVTMVANPNKCKLLAAVGSDLTEAKIIVFAHTEQKKRRAIEEQIDINSYADIERGNNVNLNNDIDANNKIDSLLRDFLKIINNDISFDVKCSGSFPGKIKFKCKFYRPKKQRKRVKREK